MKTTNLTECKLVAMLEVLQLYPGQIWLTKGEHYETHVLIKYLL
jgi:hypothetical protein